MLVTQERGSTGFKEWLPVPQIGVVHVLFLSQDGGGGF